MTDPPQDAGCRMCWDGSMGLSMSTLYSFLRGQALCWGTAKMGGEGPVSLWRAPGGSASGSSCGKSFVLFWDVVIVASCWMSSSPCGV